MRSKLGFVALTVAALACAAGCGTTAGAMRIDPPAQVVVEKLAAEPAGTADLVAVELATVVTTSDDELVTFLERATSPHKLPSSAQADLRLPPPANGALRTRIQMAKGSWTCFAQRSPRDERAAVIRTSPAGFLVPPVAWMAETIEVIGVGVEDARAWYVELAQRIATSGRATGLVRFTNGNAMAVVLELHAIEPNDTELVATSKFMRAGAYAAESFGPIVDGADSVKTKRMNEHRGVSVFDLLRKLHGAAQPTPAASATST